MYRDKVVIHLTCPKHTRFNPNIQGEGDIRGACTRCLSLVKLHETVSVLRRMVDFFDVGFDTVGRK